MKKLFLILCAFLISGCNMSNNTSEAEIIEENGAPKLDEVSRN